MGLYSGNGEVLRSAVVGGTARELVTLGSTARLRGTFQVRFQVGSSTVALGNVTLASPDSAAESTVAPRVERFATAKYQGVQLIGFNQKPGEITLVWHSMEPIPIRLTAFVHILDSAGHILAQSDAQPAAGRLPTVDWAPGLYVSDTHLLPRALPSDATTIEIGLYDAKSGQRYQPRPGPYIVGGALRMSLVAPPSSAAGSS